MIELNQLEKGSKGEQVKPAQRLLIALGYELQKSGVDGDFGDETRAATVSIQKDKKLDADGVIGINTWSALLGVLSVNYLDVIVRAAVLILSLVNLILTELGVNPIPFAGEESYAAVSSIIASLAAVWAAWKNNSVTSAAKTGDKIMAAIKAGRVTAGEAEKLLEAIETAAK